MQRCACAVLASACVIAAACAPTVPTVPTLAPPVAAAPPVTVGPSVGPTVAPASKVAPTVAGDAGTSGRLVDAQWCGDIIADKAALHALVEERLAQHRAAFAACVPPAGEGRVVVEAHIVLDVCGRGSLGYESPNEVFSATKACIDRVVQTIPFAAIGDMKFWHTHEFSFGELSR